MASKKRARLPSTEIRCDRCRRAFEPTPAESRRIAHEKARGLVFICFSCPCGNLITLNPQTGRAPSKDEDDTPLLRCPVVRCSGYVVDVKLGRRDFFGCGECGWEWRTLDQVESAIDEAIRRFPYRKVAYRRRAGHWIPSATDDEAYEEKVETEPYEPPPPKPRRRA